MCAWCEGEYPAKQVQIDHIIPVIDPTIGFVSWDDYIAKLYCAEDNLQVLCKDCHKAKTKEENKERK